MRTPRQTRYSLRKAIVLPLKLKYHKLGGKKKIATEEEYQNN